MSTSLTTGQRWLAGGIIVLGAAITPIAFIVMLVTVVNLLQPYMGDWAWTVPVGTELGFTGLFMLDLFLEWRHRPNRWLRPAPYAFAVASCWLNIAAAHGSVPAAVGHAVPPLMFFGYLLAGKAAVRSLSASDADQARATARADAMAHARDVLRAQLGRAWRCRAPVLLRRQLRSARLPASVIAAIDSSLGHGGASVWEPVVQQWVSHALTHGDRMKVSVAQARHIITRPAGETTDETPAVQPRRSSQRDRARRLIAAKPGISAGDLGKAVGVPRSTAARWKTDETRPRHVGQERAGAIHAELATSLNGKARHD